MSTICAISTPPGVGGIAVARVSGPEAIAVADRIWQGCRLGGVPSHTAHLGTVSDSRGESLDQAVATVYRAPRSYTGEDTVEFSVHGSLWIQRELLAALCAAGCRMAGPGEFTRRAFANGRLGLTEAEAVADMIASQSRAAHRVAISHLRGGFAKRLQQLHDDLLQLASLIELELDFSEEEVEFASRARLLDLATQLHGELRRLADSYRSGAAIKHGIPTAIIGATNAGKSSLLNALLGDERAIVSDIHGTTRDIVEDTAEIGDYQFRFLDTAGLRDTADDIERIGIGRSHQAARRARIVIVVADATLHTPAPEPFELARQVVSNDGGSDTAVIVVANKCDLSSSATGLERLQTEAQTLGAPLIELSTTTGQGIDRLQNLLVDTIAADAAGAGDILITNARQAQALNEAAEAAARIIDGLQAGLSGDFIAQDIRQTLHHVGSLAGFDQITTPDILQNIFARFCIGK